MAEKFALGNEMLEKVSGGSDAKYSDGPFTGKSGKNYIISWTYDYSGPYDIVLLNSDEVIQTFNSKNSAYKWIRENG